MHRVEVNLWSGDTPYLYVVLQDKVTWALHFTTMHVYTKNAQHAYWTYEDLDPEEFPLEARYVADTEWILALNKGEEENLCEVWLSCGNRPGHGNRLVMITRDRSIRAECAVSVDDMEVLHDRLQTCVGEIPGGVSTPAPVVVNYSGICCTYTMNEWRYVHADAVANID